MCLDKKCSKRLQVFKGGISVNVASLGNSDEQMIDSRSRSRSAERWFKDSMKMHTIFPIVNEESWVAGHQTLVMVLTSRRVSDKFIERSARFVTSLNNSDTIKADVMSVTDGCLYLGLGAFGDIPGGRSADSLKYFAKSKGYAQMCILEAADDE